MKQVNDPHAREIVGSVFGYGAAVAANPNSDDYLEVAIIDQAGIFNRLTVPSGPLHRLVVVASPPLSEFVWNYRREVILSRMLGTGGCAVLRQHPPGHGYSRASSTGGILRPYERNIRSILERWIELFPQLPITIVATRISSCIAVAGSSLAEVDSVVVWDYIRDPNLYIRELEVVARSLSMSRHHQDPIAEWSDGKVSSLLGYRITAEFRSEIAAMGNRATDRCTPRRALLGATWMGGVDRSTVEAFEDEVGVTPSVAMAQRARPPAWWTLDDWDPPEERRAPKACLATLTTEFVLALEH